MVRGLSALWVGQRPRPGRGRLQERRRTLVRPGGPWEEGATPRRPPLPLPSGTTRHAAAYHPCQPSPPGNVAAFSATPSGVPVAPRHTAAGGGGGSGAGAHPGARRKRQVPLPQRPWRSRWGRGLAKGAAGALRPRVELEHPKGWRRRPPGQCQSAPPASSPGTAPARNSGPGGSPPCPSPHRRRRPGSPHLSTQPGRPQETHVWLQPGGGRLGLTHLLPRPASLFTQATYLSSLGTPGGWLAVLRRVRIEGRIYRFTQ